jgi:Protein kinase domain
MQNSAARDYSWDPASLEATRLKIPGKIGCGAMGIVYQASDPSLNRPVALKTTNTEVASDPKLLKRFYREAQAAAKLSHPNIVTIYEIDKASGVPFVGDRGSRKMGENCGATTAAGSSAHDRLAG